MASWDFGGGQPSSAGGSGSWDDFSSPTPSTSSHASRESLGGEQESLPSTGHSGSAATVWLVAGLAVVLCAVVAEIVIHSVWSSFITWSLGGPIAIGLLGVFVHADTRRRADPWYAASPLVDWGRRMLVLLSLVAVATSAWSIADFFARGGF